MPFSHPHAQNLSKGPLMVYHPLMYVGEIAINRAEDTDMFGGSGEGDWDLVSVARKDTVALLYSGQSEEGVFFPLK